jgi:hypothetical protein
MKLLQACLLPPDAALEIYEQWKYETDFEHLTSAEFLLLPYLYKHLEPNFSPTDPLLPRLRGVYKQAWLRQQQRLLAQQGFLQHHPHALLEDAAWDIHAIPAMVWVDKKPKDSPVRLLDKPMPRWLYRLRHAPSEALWLVQCYRELQAVTDWQAFFELARGLGLRQRLYVVLESAMRLGLLEPQPLPQVFSLHDHAEYWRIHHPSRWGRGLARLVAGVFRFWV